MADDAQQKTDGDPASATPAPAPEKPAPAPAPAPAEVEGEGGKVDPQLIGMALALWVLAVVIFAFKWDRLRVDWYLGNIKETGDLSQKLDEPSMQALADMARGDPAIVRMVGEEVVGPLANADPFYRMALVRTLERIEGAEALGVLLQAAADPHGAVRANTYRALGQRVQKFSAEKEQVARLVVAAIGAEPEPMARAIAIETAGQLGVKDALWPVIRGVREARGTAAAIDRDAAEAGERALREKGAEAFWALSGTTKAELPFEPGAELATRDAQVRAWEAWYVRQGGKIPENDAFDQVHPPAASPPQAPPQTATEGRAQ